MNKILATVLAAAGAGAAAGGGYLIYRAIKDEDRPGRDFQPELPAMPGSTRYKKIDAILNELKASATSSGYPLGLMIGWIAAESGGRLNEVTKLDERGLYQLMPAESQSLGLDHQRLSTDLAYSIASGPLIIAKYAKKAVENGIFPQGTSAFWRLTKLHHTMGTGDVNKLADGARSAGQTGSWEEFEQYALSGVTKTKHSPSKWFPLVKRVYDIGKPFGFGSEQPMVASLGTSIFSSTDREALARAIESSCPYGSLEEKQAVGWACRNRAARIGRTVVETVAPDGVYGPRGATGHEFCSTAKPPTDETTKVACAILGLPANADPTGGAVDFWCPGQQQVFHTLGHANRAYASYTKGEDAMRASLQAVGFRPCCIVGRFELLTI